MILRLVDIVLIVLFGFTVTETMNTKIFLQVSRRNRSRLVFRFEHGIFHYLATDLRNFTLQAAYTGFTSVQAHYIPQSRIAYLNFSLFKSIVLHLFGQQVITRNGHLFVFGITRQANDFHSVKQRRRYIHAVRGCNKHHIRQIEINLEVVIGKRMVLFRIEHFQQCRCRITAEISRHFVNFIEQEQWIACTHLGQVLDHLTRQ